jgi:hypothetical protein
VTPAPRSTSVLATVAVVVGMLLALGLGAIALAFVLIVALNGYSSVDASAKGFVLTIGLTALLGPALVIAVARKAGVLAALGTAAASVFGGLLATLLVVIALLPPT